MTLITNQGPLDLCFQPAGFRDGYGALVVGAATVFLAGVDIPVASLADVVASKRAAGRPKDIVALPALEARLREQRVRAFSSHPGHPIPHPIHCA